MSLSSISLQSVNPHLSAPLVDQNVQMLDAIRGQDFNQLREVFFQQTDFNQKIKLNMEEQMLFAFLKGAKDLEFARAFCLDVLLGDENIEELAPELQHLINEISNASEANRESIDDLFPVLVESATLAVKSLSLMELEELELADGVEVSYFEIACTLNDEELVRHALDHQSKLDLKSIELLMDPCTSMRKNILEIILSYGYRIEDLLGQDQTMDDVIFHAYEEGDKNLLLFLKDHGYNTTSYLEQLD